MSSFAEFPRPTRASPPEAVAKRQAALIIGPFLKRFEGWNQRAARTGAFILSHATSQSEKVRHRDDLAALREEVETAYGEFRTAVSDQPRHSRIDDVDAAFGRMLSVLERAAD